MYERCKQKPRSMMLLHGERSSGQDRHPNIALITHEQELVLVEIERDISKAHDEQRVLDGLLAYQALYGSKTMGDLAQWYCQYNVDTNSHLGYRDSTYILHGDPQNSSKHFYGRINRLSEKNFDDYCSVANNGADALQVLKRDFTQHFDKPLNCSEHEHLKVEKCIIVATGFRDGFVPSSENMPIELWTYKQPADWLTPFTPS